MNQPPAAKLQGASRILITAVAVRLVLDAGVQVVWPYLPIIARGLAVSVATIGVLLSLRGLVGLTSPIFGALSDRLGAKRLMVAGLALVALSSGILAAGPGLVLAALAFALNGVGGCMFLPALQAYISNQLAYTVRGRILSAVEFSWALAGIALLPLFGVLITTTNWRAPFLILAAAALLAIPAILNLPEHDLSHTVVGPVSLGHLWHGMTSVLRNNRSGLASVSVTMCMYFAAMNVLFVYGAWLEAQFGLNAEQIGLVATAMGLADFCGSGLSSAIIDRIGKRRVVLAGLCWLVLAYLFLQMGNNSLALAVTGLVALRFGFEFSLVSNISLISEQAPQQRAAMFSWSTFAASLATAVAGLTSGSLWLWKGIQANVTFSELLALAALFLCFRFVVDRGLQPGAQQGIAS